MSRHQQTSRFKNFSPEKKLDLSLQLYYSAKELKRAALRQFHPDWDSKKIEEEVKRIFLHTRT
jgi:hypothetical protein